MSRPETERLRALEAEKRALQARMAEISREQCGLLRALLNAGLSAMQIVRLGLSVGSKPWSTDELERARTKVAKRIKRCCG